MLWPIEIPGVVATHLWTGSTVELGKSSRKALYDQCQATLQPKLRMLREWPSQCYEWPSAHYGATFERAIVVYPTGLCEVGLLCSGCIVDLRFTNEGRYPWDRTRVVYTLDEILKGT